MEPGSFWTALVWAIVPMLLLLTAIWWIDRYEKEPLRLLGLALVFGGLLAPLIAYALERAFDIATSLASQQIVPESELGVGTPLVEEIVRGLAVLAVFLLVRFEIDDLLDGLVYGGIVGAGFGAAANFVGIWKTPSLGADTDTSLFTSLISQLNHVFYGALIGLALAAVRRRELPVLLGALAVGIGLAFFFHVLHDYIPWWTATDSTNLESGWASRVLTQVPNYLGLVALGAIALWTIGRQKLIVGRNLEGEVKSGVVTQGDYANVTNSFRRSYTMWNALLRGGDREFGLRRRLYAAEVELAFRKFHRSEDKGDSRLYLEEDDYREQIKDLRKTLVQVSPAYEAEGKRGAPKPPSNTVVAGLGGLTVFAALVIAGVLLWLLALRPDRQPTSTEGFALTATAFRPVAAPPERTPAGAALAGMRLAAPAASAAASVNVAMCSDFTAQVRCVGPYRLSRTGFTIPRARPGAAMVASFKEIPRGATFDFQFFNLGTKQPVSNTFRYKVTSPSGRVGIRLRGPFPKARFFILFKYNGRVVNFNPPLVLNFV
ncbi:MAG: PrsW family intramembrane metalloprotease [Gaiellaceae bacterium]